MNKIDRKYLNQRVKVHRKKDIMFGKLAHISSRFVQLETIAGPSVIAIKYIEKIEYMNGDRESAVVQIKEGSNPRTRKYNSSKKFSYALWWKKEIVQEAEE